jgi:multidrug resistance protein, MATE family
VAVVPVVIYALALWGPGLIGGYLVAFRPIIGRPLGVQGMWLMLALALALTATALVAFYLWFLQREKLGAVPALSASDRRQPARQ